MHADASDAGSDSELNQSVTDDLTEEMTEDLTEDLTTSLIVEDSSDESDTARPGTPEVPASVAGLAAGLAVGTRAGEGQTGPSPATSPRRRTYREEMVAALFITGSRGPFSFVDLCSAPPAARSPVHYLFLFYLLVAMCLCAEHFLIVGRL